MHRAVILAAALGLVIGTVGCAKHETEKHSGDPSMTDVAPAPASGPSFYEIGLTCAAAPKIGCGSRAKPILLSLKADSHVAGAWLNEAGTRLAIEWRQPAAPLTIDQLEAVFDQHGVALQPVADAERSGLSAAFKRNAGWYDAATVDRLSEREAGIIAARFVRRLAAKASVSDEQQTQLRTELESALRAYIVSGRAAAADETARSDEVRARMVAAARPLVDGTVISALEEVVALGYRPLPNEE